MTVTWILKQMAIIGIPNRNASPLTTAVTTISQLRVGMCYALTQGKFRNNAWNIVCLVFRKPSILWEVLSLTGWYHENLTKMAKTPNN